MLLGPALMIISLEIPVRRGGGLENNTLRYRCVSKQVVSNIYKNNP